MLFYAEKQCIGKLNKKALKNETDG